MQDYNICLCADENYAKYMGVTIASILKNSTEEENIIFHIISSNISDNNKNKLNNLKNIKNCNIVFYDIDNKKYGDPHRLKLFIPELIKNTNKVLYLDSDIIVTGSLKDFFKIDMENYYILAAKDMHVDKNIEHKKSISLNKDDIYFNSGVIMFNNELCVKDNICNNFEDYYKNNINRMVFFDQDILNYVFKNKVKIIDNKWNFFPFRDYNHKPDQPNYEEAIIVHFVYSKPWKDDCSNPYFLYDYWKYYQYTPWFFEEPITAIQTIIQQKFNDYEDIRLRSNYLKLFGIYTNSYKLQIVIFGIRITIDTVNFKNIEKIAWWIPIRKWRENLKNKFR